MAGELYLWLVDLFKNMLEDENQNLGAHVNSKDQLRIIKIGAVLILPLTLIVVFFSKEIVIFLNGIGVPVNHQSLALLYALISILIIKLYLLYKKKVIKIHKG